MPELQFNITINSPAAKVWQVLWYDATYRKWTSAFTEGSHAVSDWKEGSKVHFLTPEGDGMYSVISACKQNELMAFKHIGVIKKFEEQPVDAETESWGDAREIYSLKENNGSTELTVNLDSVESFADYLNKTFPVALNLLKEIAEKPVAITIEATINAPIEKVWKYWTAPEHIIQWNNASDDWHTPAATNDLKVGGNFIITMAAKDGSMSFDFTGTYNDVKENELITYSIVDGRKVRIDFSAAGNQTKIVESFEAEQENSLDLQQGGWQSILNNFKKYTEAN